MTEDLTIGAVAALGRYVDDILVSEVIGGTSMKDAAEWVDLSACDDSFPVCPLAVETHGMYIPAVATATRLQGDRYLVEMDGRQEFASPVTLKMWRARFLLWRGVYHDRLAKGALSYSDQREVIANFFGGSVHIPNVLLPKDRQVTGKVDGYTGQPYKADDTFRDGRWYDIVKIDAMTDSHIFEERQGNKLRVSCHVCGESGLLDRVGKGKSAYWEGYLKFQRDHSKCSG